MGKLSAHQKRIPFLYSFFAVAIAASGFLFFAPSAHAAISRVEIQSALGSGSAATVSFSTSTTAGELIVVEEINSPAGTQGGTPTDNKGDTFYKVFDQSNIFSHGSYSLWYAYNVPSGVTTVSSTPGTGNNISEDFMFAAHYTGIATSSPLDVFASTPGGSGQSSPWASPAVSTTQANELMVGGDYCNAAGGSSCGDAVTIAMSGNWTTVATSSAITTTSNAPQLVYGDQIVSSLQTNASSTGTGGGASFNFPFIATFSATPVTQATRSQWVEFGLMALMNRALSVFETQTAITIPSPPTLPLMQWARMMAQNTQDIS
jgi:hypothetical protein